MFTKSLLAFASCSLAALAALSPALQPQGGGLGGSGLNNCDIDLRQSNHREAQVYWSEEGTGDFGMTFDIWDTIDEVLMFGAIDPKDGLLKEYKLKKGKENKVVFKRHGTTNYYDVEFFNGTTSLVKFDNVPSATEFDALGKVIAPLQEEVRRDASGMEKRRFRFTCGNYGLTFWFVLSDV